MPDPNFKPTAKKGKDIDAGHEGEDVDYMPGAFITEYSPAAIPIPSESALTNVPCGLCPVFEECVPGGLISPETCEYMDAWLAQDDP